MRPLESVPETSHSKRHGFDWKFFASFMTLDHTCQRYRRIKCVGSPRSHHSCPFLGGLPFQGCVCFLLPSPQEALDDPPTHLQPDQLPSTLPSHPGNMSSFLSLVPLLKPSRLQPASTFLFSTKQTTWIGRWSPLWWA